MEIMRTVATRKITEQDVYMVAEAINSGESKLTDAQVQQVIEIFYDERQEREPWFLVVEDILYRLEDK